MKARSGLFMGMGGLLLAFLAAVVILVARDPQAFIRESMNVIYSKESRYQNIYVTKDDSVLWLRAGSLMARSSAMDVNNPFVHVIEYTRMMMIGSGYVKDPESILVVGLGGGTLTKYLRRYYPGSRIVNVEFDRAVVDVAERFFEFIPDDRMEVVVEDGRRYLAKSEERFDMIFLDAFHGDYIPFHLMTREFLELVKSRLTERGVVISNTWLSPKLSDRESATYGVVFGNFDSYRGSKSLNRIIIAEKNGRKRLYEKLEAAMRRVQNEIGFKEINLPELFRKHYVRDEGPWKGKILEDDYAPVNLLVKTGPTGEDL